jgi:hypothetical protein
MGYGMGDMPNALRPQPQPQQLPGAPPARGRGDVVRYWRPACPCDSSALESIAARPSCCAHARIDAGLEVTAMVRAHSRLTAATATGRLLTLLSTTSS